MGQRANLVIVRGDAWRLYYDHWCANRLDVELFWGPALAVEFIEQREALADAGDWLDEGSSTGSPREKLQVLTALRSALR